MTRPRPAWQPPMRDGVSASRVAVTAGPWTTALDFLRVRLPAADDWPERLAAGEVLDAEGQAVRASTPARPGLLLWYWRCPPPEWPVPEPFAVLHQDQHIVVADKPHFMPMTPGGRHLHQTLLVQMKRQLGLASLSPVHRLDLETAGLVLLTVDTAVRPAYHAMMREHAVQRVYEAVAPWRDDLPWPVLHSSRLEEQDGPRFMQMRTAPGEPNASTHVEVIQQLSERLAHYRLTPVTGRKHQLRAHLNELGIPIVGDRIYPKLWPEAPRDQPPDFSNPLQLLARELRFQDPLSGQERRFMSQRRLALVP
jgi:tRNA pseudouridine32 synthase / 23S rRNA pseudouridine746 synthase